MKFLIDFISTIDYIPKKSIKDKFLSTKIKQMTKLPTSFDRELLQKYYYKRLIESSKNIFISYVNSDSNQISRFANELFPKSIDEKIYDNYYRHILYNNHNISHFDENIIRTKPVRENCNIFFNAIIPVRFDGKSVIHPKQLEIANEVRRVMNCDRVSVVQWKGSRCKIIAISGQPSVNHRSNTVQSLRKLSERILPLRTMFWYPCDAALPTQIESPLNSYLAESSTRALVLVPSGSR